MTTSKNMKFLGKNEVENMFFSSVETLLDLVSHIGGRLCMNSTGSFHVSIPAGTRDARAALLIGRLLGEVWLDLARRSEELAFAGLLNIEPAAKPTPRRKGKEVRR